MSVSGITGNTSAEYAVETAKKAIDAQKLEGQEAVKLIESAQAAGAVHPTPDGATISVYA